MFLNLTFIHDAFDIGNPSGMHKVFVSEFFPVESSWDLSLKTSSKKPLPKKPLSKKKNPL